MYHKIKKPGQGDGRAINSKEELGSRIPHKLRRTVNPHKFLSPEEKRQVILAASNQEEKIRIYFQLHPDKKHTYAEIMQMFRFRESSAKRALSNLSNSKPDAPWIDGNGQPPILKLPQKRLNPDTGIKVSLYQYNPLHGKPKEERQHVLFPEESWRV